MSDLQEDTDRLNVCLVGDFSENLDEGYKLIAETAPKLDPSERQYRFRNPVDRQGLLVLLKDIIQHVIKDGRIQVSDIITAFKEALRESQLEE